MSSGSNKGYPDVIYFSLKESRKANPLQIPQRGPYGERYLLTGYFEVSLVIYQKTVFNPSNAKLNPIRHFLALLGAHNILQVSRIRINMSFGVPSKEALPPDPHHGVPSKRE